MGTNVLRHPLQRRLGHRMMQGLRREIAHLREQRARRAAYRALAVLDDRTLQDIGIPRHEIWAAVNNTFATHDPRTGANVLRTGRGVKSEQEQHHSLAA